MPIRWQNLFKHALKRLVLSVKKAQKIKRIQAEAFLFFKEFNQKHNAKCFVAPITYPNGIFLFIEFNKNRPIDLDSPFFGFNEYANEIKKRAYPHDGDVFISPLVLDFNREAIQWEATGVKIVLFYDDYIINKLKELRE